MGSEFSIRQGIQLFTLEQTMTEREPEKKICRQIAMVGMCILISGWMAAQTDTAKNADNTKSDAPTGRCGPEYQRERRPCAR